MSSLLQEPLQELVTLIEASGLTHRTIALKNGVSCSIISRAVRQGKPLSLETLVKLLAFFGRKLEYKLIPVSPCPADRVRNPRRGPKKGSTHARSHTKTRPSRRVPRKA